MITFGQLKEQLRRQIWASGEAENLITQHDLIFQEAAADIAKWVPCEQDDNLNVIDFCKTFFKNGLTIVKAPRGVINRIFTVANNNYDDPVYYDQKAWPEPECWAQNVLNIASPANDGRPSLPLGFKYADAETDRTAGVANQRARTGIWAVHQKNIWIAPWINSNEQVFIEWHGIKNEWSDLDPVNPAQDYRKAVKLYVQYAHERDYGNMEKAAAFLVRRPGQADTGLYADALADLIHQCREETKVRETHACSNPRPRYLEELQDDAVPET